MNTAGKICDLWAVEQYAWRAQYLDHDRQFLEGTIGDKKFQGLDVTLVDTPGEVVVLSMYISYYFTYVTCERGTGKKYSLITLLWCFAFLKSPLANDWKSM